MNTETDLDVTDSAFYRWVLLPASLMLLSLMVIKIKFDLPWYYEAGGMIVIGFGIIGIHLLRVKLGRY